MKPTPTGWPRISSGLYYDDAGEAIDWLCRAFGFEVRIRVNGPDGRVAHSELTYGDGLVMVGEAGRADKYPYRRSPGRVGGGNTQNLMVYVDDVEAHYRRAREAGAQIVSPPATIDYGPEHWADRGYECSDPGGHHWWFFQRIRDPA
ncbi:MAG TPA: VOC family protein [Anaeromyxobacteraceae bacterium]|nr:VOC family protein [Anaeromyxobacteraceae bacterium]